MGTESKSCVGCKYLYSIGLGYSNYTWLDNEVRCALGRNPNLGAEEPSDWNKSPDNWQCTKDSRCELYANGEYIALDVDGENGPADFSADEEQIAAICSSSGRGRHGYQKNG